MDRAGPPLGEPGPGQVGGELAACIPDRLAAPGGIARGSDGVPGDLAGVRHAVPQPDQDAGLVQAGEELIRAGGECGGGGHEAAQGGPGRLRACHCDGGNALTSCITENNPFSVINANERGLEAADSELDPAALTAPLGLMNQMPPGAVPYHRS
jgi:hypothetical protein